MKVLAWLASFAVMVTMAATPAVAEAREQTLTSDQVSEVNAFFDTYGVSRHTQALLIERWEAGDAWDSMNGSPPVSTGTIAGRSTTTQVQRFADGSVAVSSVENGTSFSVGGVTPMSVGGCTTVVSGLNRTKTNCLVKASVGVMEITFWAEYKYAYAVATDAWVKSASITRVWNPTGRVIGGTFADLGLALNRKVATNANPANARASMIAYGVGGVYAETVWVDLMVPCGGYPLVYSRQWM